MISAMAELLGFGASDPSFWVPLVLISVLFIIFVAGVIFDGFDIGVGCLAMFAPTNQRPVMLGMLKPWRDANELWFFLGLGLFLAAFPYAWTQTIGRLYLPLSLLACGYILRSVCYEFRLRSTGKLSRFCGFGFAAGSLLTAFSHGYILARVIVGYDLSAGYVLFAVIVGLCAICAYSVLGSCWLVMRVSGELRQRSIRWALKNLRISAVALVGISLVLGSSNAGVFIKWGGNSGWQSVSVLWLLILLCFVFMEMSLQRMVVKSLRISALPYALILSVFLLALSGIAYSFFPYLVLDEITIWDASAPVDALRVVLYLTLAAAPVAIAFNIWVYWRMLGQSKSV